MILASLLVSPFYLLYYLLAFVITLPVAPILYGAWMVCALIDLSTAVFEERISWMIPLVPPYSLYTPGYYIIQSQGLDLNLV